LSDRRLHFFAAFFFTAFFGSADGPS
jgi:hypothetical protein